MWIVPFSGDWVKAELIMSASNARWNSSTFLINSMAENASCVGIKLLEFWECEKVGRVETFGQRANYLYDSDVSTFLLEKNSI